MAHGLPPDWATWQLVDSLLPTGAFAHSLGLEAAMRQGLLGLVGHAPATPTPPSSPGPAVRSFAAMTLTNVTTQLLPFVHSAHVLFQGPTGSEEEEEDCAGSGEVDPGEVERVCSRDDVGASQQGPRKQGAFLALVLGSILETYYLDQELVPDELRGALAGGCACWSDELAVRAWAVLDAVLHASLTNHVARRASLGQGSALLRVVCSWWHHTRPQAPAFAPPQPTPAATLRGGSLADHPAGPTGLQPGPGRPRTFGPPAESVVTSPPPTPGSARVVPGGPTCLEPGPGRVPASVSARTTGTPAAAAAFAPASGRASGAPEADRPGMVLGVIRARIQGDRRRLGSREPPQQPSQEGRVGTRPSEGAGVEAVAWGHHATVFGAASALLGIPRESACRAYLYSALRDVMSAATRLSLIGPMEAASLQRGLAPGAESMLQCSLASPLPCPGSTPAAQAAVRGSATHGAGNEQRGSGARTQPVRMLSGESHSACPMLDLSQAAHDALPMRLFLS